MLMLSILMMLLMLLLSLLLLMVVVLVVACCCMLLVGCGLLYVVVCCLLFIGCCAGQMIQPVHSVHPLQLLSAKNVDGRGKMDQLSKKLTAGPEIDSWSTPSMMLRPTLRAIPSAQNHTKTTQKQQSFLWGPGNSVETLLRYVVFFNTQQHKNNRVSIRRIIRKHECRGTKQNVRSKQLQTDRFSHSTYEQQKSNKANYNY